MDLDTLHLYGLRTEPISHLYPMKSKLPRYLIRFFCRFEIHLNLSLGYELDQSFAKKNRRRAVTRKAYESEIVFAHAVACPLRTCS